MNSNTQSSQTSTQEKSAAAAAAVLARNVRPYLFFEGRCEEAMDFYRDALGATEIVLLRFKDSPEPAMCGAMEGDKILHASFRIGETVISASDGRCTGSAKFEGFSLTISAATLAGANQLLGRLAEGGMVQQPMIKTFFSEGFGMVSDRFGVSWMILVTP